tara:strand:+ start:3014 stop:7741 length:4728 start_codon:yes stop_codon:yes gene_type:complete
MPDYLNAIDSTIPKVRVQRISLSSGGNTIVEDNPHIVETGFNAETAGAVSSEIAAKIEKAIDDFYDITSQALTTDERREYITRAWSGSGHGPAASRGGAFLEAYADFLGENGRYMQIFRDWIWQRNSLDAVSPRTATRLFQEILNKATGAYAVNKVVQEFLVRTPVREGPWGTARFEDVFNQGRFAGLGGKNYGFLRSIANVIDKFGPMGPWDFPEGEWLYRTSAAYDPGSYNAATRATTPELLPNFAINELVRFIQSPNLSSEYILSENTELLLGALFAGRSYNITLAGLKDLDAVYGSLHPCTKELNGRHHTALQTIVLPFIYEIVRRASVLYYQDLVGRQQAWGAAVDSSVLYTAQSNTEEMDPSVSVKTLVNIKVVQPATTAFSTLMSNEQLAQQLEFLAVWVKDDPAYEGRQPIGEVYEFVQNLFRNATTETGWWRLFRIASQNPQEYIDTALLESGAPGRIAAQSFNIFEMMEGDNNPYSELQRDATTDKDGNRTYDINFELPEQILTASPRNLRLYILPYLNIVGFIQQLNLSAGVDLSSVLDVEHFGKYAPFFVGDPTGENIIENGALVRTSSVFFVDQSVEGYRAGEQWKGPVFYDTGVYSDSDNPQHHVGEERGRLERGWYGGNRRDSNRIQPRLRIEYLPNNKIQDNRIIDKIQRFEHNLGLTDIKEFLPSIGGLTQENNNVIYQKLDPVTEVSITSDSDRVNKLFFGIDMETAVFQNSPVGAYFRRLAPSERRKVMSHVEINSLEIIRHQIRDLQVHNRLGGQDTDYPNVGTRETATAPYIVVESGDMATAATLNTNSTTTGRITEVTDLLANKNAGDYTAASVTLANFAYQVGTARFFSAEDISAGTLTGGAYQYGVKFKILDKTQDYIKDQRSQLQGLLNDLSQYYNLVMDKQNYNNALNRPHDSFIRAMEGVGNDIPRSVKTVAQRLYERNGIFINTLATLSSVPDNFNREEVSNILRNFLVVCTCSRETLHRIMNLLQNTLSKIDQLLSISVKPHYPNSEVYDAREGGARPPRVFTIERKSSKTIQAGQTATNGYYYLNARYTKPNSARIINARDGGDWQRWEEAAPHGIRILEPSYIAALSKKETNKSFLGPQAPMDQHVAPGSEGVPDFAKPAQYSYLTPQYIVMDAHGSNPDQGVAIMQSLPESLQNPDLFVFEHAYNIAASPPRYQEYLSSYDLTVARIRLLNELIKTDAIPVIAEDFYTRSPQNPNVQIPNRNNQGRLEDTLNKIFTFQNASVFKKSSFNYLLSRMAIGIQNLANAIEQDDDSPSAASMLGLNDSFTIQGRGLAPGSDHLNPDSVAEPLGTDVYFETFDVPDSADTANFFDALLDSQKTSLSRKYINLLFSGAEDIARRQFEEALEAGNIYNNLPNSVKLISTNGRPEPDRYRNPADLWQRNYDGFVDIHLNKTMEIQVLEGFNTMEDDAGSILIMDSPRWRKATAQDFDYTVLCRLVPYQNDTLRVVHPAYLDMAVFDEMFIVKGRLTEVQGANPVVNPEFQVAGVTDKGSVPPAEGVCDVSYAVTLPLVDFGVELKLLDIPGSNVASPLIDDSGLMVIDDAI